MKTCCKTVPMARCIDNSSAVLVSLCPHCEILDPFERRTHLSVVLQGCMVQSREDTNSDQSPIG